MRFGTSILLACTALTASVNAQDQQKPLLNSWLDKAKSYISTGIPSPSEAGAAAIASQTVTDLTASNWQSVLSPRANEASPQNWLIQITGRNKTCAGKCEPLDANFNKTASLLAVTPGGPHLGRVNCDDQPALCSIFFVGPAVLWYVQIPGHQAADQTRAPTPIYVKGLNATEGYVTSVQDMVDFHSKKEYLGRKLVEGYMHPFDGTLAKYGLNVPVGYALHYFSIIPSWGVMLLVSFFTRNVMSRRMASQQRPIPSAGGGAAAAAGGSAAKKSN